ncbi:hypothetical protein Bbelb_043180 [Branchiostoma belcheri]|nr:hypothetical protein Bbelb_043180 [Branchiostoma belcheri]
MGQKGMESRSPYPRAHSTSPVIIGSLRRENCTPSPGRPETCSGGGDSDLGELYKELKARVSLARKTDEECHISESEVRQISADIKALELEGETPKRAYLDITRGVDNRAALYVEHLEKLILEKDQYFKECQRLLKLKDKYADDVRYVTSLQDRCAAILREEADRAKKEKDHSVFEEYRAKDKLKKLEATVKEMKDSMRNKTRTSKEGTKQFARLQADLQNAIETEKELRQKVDELIVQNFELTMELKSLKKPMITCWTQTENDVTEVILVAEKRHKMARQERLDHDREHGKTIRQLEKKLQRMNESEESREKEVKLLSKQLATLQEKVKYYMGKSRQQCPYHWHDKETKASVVRRKEVPPKTPVLSGNVKEGDKLPDYSSRPVTSMDSDENTCKVSRVAPSQRRSLPTDSLAKGSPDFQKQSASLPHGGAFSSASRAAIGTPAVGTTGATPALQVRKNYGHPVRYCGEGNQSYVLKYNSGRPETVQKRGGGEPKRTGRPNPFMRPATKRKGDEKIYRFCTS